jgi:hypothetical protein
MKKMTALRLAAIAAAFVLSVQQPSAYLLKSAKWNSSSVLFYVNSQNLDVAASSAVSALQFGASTWTNQTAAAFSFAYAGATSGTTVTNNGRNEVFFRNSSNGSAIATTYTYSSGGRILDTDIVFWDGAYQFFTGESGCSGGFYIEDVAAHEFGHALGLGHSDVSGATMGPSIRYCAVDARWLADDDRLGVEALYPSAASNTAPLVSISTPSTGHSLTEGDALTFSGSASDGEDGNLASSIEWLSSRDGKIGTGATFQRVLSAGSHTITASVVDSGGSGAQSQVTISVQALAATTEPGGISLNVRGYKVKGLQKAELSWGGATTATVDIYRNGTKLMTTSNSGRYTDAINIKGSGSYSYAVCEAGTSTCSASKGITY